MGTGIVKGFEKRYYIHGQGNDRYNGFLKKEAKRAWRRRLNRVRNSTGRVPGS